MLKLSLATCAGWQVCSGYKSCIGLVCAHCEDSDEDFHDKNMSENDFLEFLEWPKAATKEDADDARSDASSGASREAPSESNGSSSTVPSEEVRPVAEKNHVFHELPGCPECGMERTCT